LKTISSDETTHVSFLTTALGSAAVSECPYNFPATTPAEFVALSSVLEGVGVAAYLGAAADIANPDYLTDAGSILTVEARHNAYVRAALKESPFPQPFDDPLDFDEVFTLAAMFIDTANCPSLSKLPAAIKPFPTLALGTTGTIKNGTEITLLTPGYSLEPKDGMTPLYAAFITVLGPIYAPATPTKGGFTTVVPPGINGQSYAVLTACNDKKVLTDDVIQAGPAIIEITN